MIRRDTGGDIGSQLLAAQPWGMAVHALALGHLDLFEHLRVAMDHAGEVHHLPEPLYPFLLYEAFEVFCPDLGTCGLQSGCRHARGKHNKEVEGDRGDADAHELYPLDAHDVGDLVKVGYDCCHAVGDNCPRIFFYSHHAALDVHMGVEEARGEKFALQVQYFLRRILAEANYLTLGDGDGLRFNRSREDVDKLGVCQEEVCLFFAFGKCYAVSYLHGFIRTRVSHYTLMFLFKEREKIPLPLVRFFAREIKPLTS